MAARLLLGLVLTASVVAGCFNAGPAKVGDATAAEASEPRAAPSVEPAGDHASNHRRGGFSDMQVFPGTYDLTGNYSRPLTPGPWPILPGEILKVRSRADGVALFVALWRPAVPIDTRVPIIVDASPYFDFMTIDDIQNVHARSMMRYEQYVLNFVPHGYAVAFVALRGTSVSGGCLDLFGPLDRADLSQVIDALANESWSNGNVALLGLSHDGGAAWAAAATGNPHVKTIVPIGSIPDLFGWMFPNGTLGPIGSTGIIHYYGIYAFGGEVSTKLLKKPPNPERACPQAAVGSAAQTWATATGERDPFKYFQERDNRGRVGENYTGSVLLVHGLRDWLQPAHIVHPFVSHLEARGVVVKQLLGQWEHENPDGVPWWDDRARWDWAEILLHWFDYWLKGDHAVDLGPRVQVQDNLGRWRNENSWPPTDAVAQSFFLAPGDAPALPVDANPPPGRIVDQPVDGFVLYRIGHNPAYIPEPLADPFARTNTRCPEGQCPRFLSPPQDHDVRFAGRPTVHATVVPSGPGGVVGVHLDMVRFVGENEKREFRLGWAELDLRFANGTEEANRVVVPSQEFVARLQLEPLDVVVPAGYQLSLTFTQGGYWDRAPGVAQGPILVKVGGESTVFKIDVIQRGPDIFFRPPGA